MRPSERRRLRVVTSYVYEVGVYFDRTLAFYARARAVKSLQENEQPAEDEAIIIGELDGKCTMKFGKRYAAQIADAAKKGCKVGISVHRRAGG